MEFPIPTCFTPFKRQPFKRKMLYLFTMQKLFLSPTKEHQQGTKIVTPFHFTSPFESTHATHTMLEIGEKKKKESNEGFHAMSGDPLTKNPHKNLCGQG